MAAGGEYTADGYIEHHLTNLTFGKFNEAHARAAESCTEQCVSVGDWGFAQSAQEAAQMGFMSIKFYYGFMILRPERMAVQYTSGTL